MKHKGTDCKITWNGVTMEVTDVEITEEGRSVGRAERAATASAMVRASDPNDGSDVQTNCALFDNLTGDGFKFDLVTQTFYEIGQKHTA